MLVNLPRKTNKQTQLPYVLYPKMLAMSTLMMPAPTMALSAAPQLTVGPHKPPETKLLTIHPAHSAQSQTTPQHQLHQQHQQQQQQAQQQQQQQQVAAQRLSSRRSNNSNCSSSWPPPSSRKCPRRTTGICPRQAVETQSSRCPGRRPR